MNIDVNKIFTALESFGIDGFSKKELEEKLKYDPIFPILLWEVGYSADDHLVILTQNLYDCDYYSDDENDCYCVENIFKEITTKVQEFKKDFTTSPSEIQIEIFNLVDSPLSPLKFDEKNIVNKTREKLSSMFKNLKNKQISIHSILINKVETPESISISVDSRVRSIEQEEVFEEKNLVLKSYVFSAQLKSVLELYKIYGSDLFYKNVRNGIADELGVETSIGETLQQKENNKFWYLNNGISLFVRDDSFLDMSPFGQVNIDLTKNKEYIPISIINGAQTVTTSARYYKDISEEQRVLLRIYSFRKTEDSDKNDTYNTNVDKLIDEITIALNRQKPIKIDDLSYTSDFVKAINENYSEGNKFSFEIIRRGVIGGKNSYSLLDFSKIVSAYLLQNPANSISKGSITFLKMKEGAFENKEIFQEEINLDNKEVSAAISKFYKPVNFSFRLKEYLEKKLENIVDQNIVDQNIETENVSSTKNVVDALKEYGMYFVLSGVVRLISKEEKVEAFSEENGKGVDFSKWKYVEISEEESEDKISEEELNKYINKVIKNYFDYAKDNLTDQDNYRKIMKNKSNYEKSMGIN